MRNLIELFGGHFMSPVANPYPVYAALRREEPVALLDLPIAPGYMVTRYDDVRAVLGDPQSFSSRSNSLGAGMVMGRTILEMDGKDHLRHRNTIAPAFVPKAVRHNLPDTIGSIAHKLLDEIAGQGEADLVAQFTYTFPLRVIAQMIGVPIEDFHRFHRLALELISFSEDFARAYAASEQLVKFLRPIVEARKTEPRDDLLTTLLTATVDGERLTDEEILSFLRLLLPAGADTTYRLVTILLLALLTHREQLEEIEAQRSLIANAIEETLRWEAPVQFASREALRDTVVGGVTIPAGRYVLAALGSANRDESHYAEPDRWDLHRDASDHMAFGFGRHFCLGSHLARLETTIAINAILDRLPNLELVEVPPITGLAFRAPARLPVRFG